MQAGFVEHVLKQTLLVWLVCPCWQVTFTVFCEPLYLLLVSKSLQRKFHRHEYWEKAWVPDQILVMEARHWVTIDVMKARHSVTWDDGCISISNGHWLDAWFCIYQFCFLLSSNKTRCIYDLSTMEIVCFCIEFESKNVQW